MILEKGRVCLKIAGREAGKYCVVVEPVDENFVMVAGPKTVTSVKRRKCNVLHLEPTDKTLNVKTGADAELEDLWKKSGLIEDFAIEMPRIRQKK